MKKFLYCLLILGFVLACSSRDEVTAIRELIEEGARLGEKHDIAGLIDLTSEDFFALPGDLDRLQTKRVLWRAFQHYGSFRILHPLPGVDVDSGRGEAAAIFPFLVLRKGGSLPKLEKLYQDPQKWLEEVGESADLYRMKLVLVKRDGRWVARQALLERFTGASFEE